MGWRFSLAPHPANASLPQVQITGTLERNRNHISLRLQMFGPLHHIRVPARSKAPARRSGLWEKTCFELFLAPENSVPYWEFNLSPAGHWNVFRFTGYREGMVEDRDFTSLPFTTQVRADSLLLHLELDAARIFPDCTLQAGVSAVVRARGGQTSFWALAHREGLPDFHARECFTVRLACGRGRGGYRKSCGSSP